MLKLFFRDSAVYTFSGVLSRGVPVILLPLYTSILSTKEFGIWEYIQAVGSVLLILIPLEVTQGMARYFAETSIESEKNNYVKTTLAFSLICYLISLALSLFFLNSLSSFLLGQRGSFLTLFFCLLFFLLNGMVYTVQNILRWNMQAYDNAKFSLIIAIVFTIMAIFLLKSGYGLNGLLFSSILASVVGLMYVIIYSKISLSGRFDWVKAKQMLQFSLPLVPSSLGVVVALYVDRLLIKNMLDIDSMAFYSVAYRISTLIIIVMIGFQGALTPLLYANYKNAEMRKDLAKLFRLFVMVALLLWSFISLFIKEGLIYFLNSSYQSAASIVPYLVLSTLLWQMYIFAPGLSIEKKTKLIAIINISVAIINLLFNLLLIKYLGLIGSGIATLLSALISFFLYMMFSQKYYSVNHDWSVILKSVLATVCVIIISFQIPAQVPFYFVKPILLAFLFFMFLKFKLFELGELKQILK